ncbi:MAG TPA: ABC transporter ATP-binding protein [Myxococcales bacterium]|nr:ABC transporter ATP-binding protein [Myxococcales bacterium]HIN85947.1 ABC transporter ATP-binding protein [Myxococcales bacterium]
MTAVCVQDLSKSFRPTTSWGHILRGQFKRPPVTAVTQVNLTVSEGELVGLAGPNGAGKSTLLRVISGLLEPTEGRVEAFGHVPSDGVPYRQTVGFALGGDRSHFWRLTASQNLQFFAALHGQQGTAATENVERVLGIVHLNDDADRPVREFSTGMRQRLSLARGLLGTPKLLLLDEPTRGLDPRSARQLREFVRDELVAKQKVTVLYATHQVQEMQELCPRMLLMDEGRLVGDGSFAELHDTFDEVFA